MKKIALALVSFALAFSFAGCGGKSSSTPLNDTLVSQTPSPSATVTNAQFVAFIKEHTDAFDNASNAEVIKAAKGFCGVWAAGGTMKDQMIVILSSKADTHDAAYLLGAGTAMYCPQYNNRIKK